MAGEAARPATAWLTLLAWASQCVADMSRRIAQAAITVTAALTLGGCAVPTDTHTEPQTGQAEEEVEEKALPLPHTERLYVHGVQTVGPFDLPKGATLTVIIKPRWDRPGGCQRTPIYLEPARKRAIINAYTDTLERWSVVVNDTEQIHPWKGLETGRYHVDVDLPGRDPYCHVVGTITVKSP